MTKGSAPADESHGAEATAIKDDLEPAVNIGFVAGHAEGSAERRI